MTLQYLGKRFHSKRALENFKLYIMPKIVASIKRYYYNDPVLQQVWSYCDDFVKNELEYFSICNVKGLRYKTGGVYLDGHIKDRTGSLVQRASVKNKTRGAGIVFDDKGASSARENKTEVDRNV